MPVEYFLRYKGKCYDVGTQLKFKVFSNIILEGTIISFSHNQIYIRLTDGTTWKLSKVWPLDNTIIEIVKPVYYTEPQKPIGKYGTPPPMEDVFVGWMWYIAIMAVGIIFKDRWLIWIFATIIFFAWKNGGMKK